MNFWVAADASPVVAREILFRAADRVGVQVSLVAKQPLCAPASKNVNTIQVPKGFDVADDEITSGQEYLCEEVNPGRGIPVSVSWFHRSGARGRS